RRRSGGLLRAARCRYERHVSRGDRARVASREGTRTMKSAWVFAIGVVWMAVVAGTGWCQGGAAGGGPGGSDAGDTMPVSPGAAAAEAELAGPAGPGQEQVDTAAGDRELRDFERSPHAPQVFLHQWYYHEPAISQPESSSADLGVAQLTLAEAVHAAL